jgi:hypothetical protein
VEQLDFTSQVLKKQTHLINNVIKAMPNCLRRMPSTDARKPGSTTLNHSSTTTFLAETPAFRVSSASCICERPPLMMSGSGFATNWPLAKAAGTYFRQTASLTCFSSVTIFGADTVEKYISQQVNWKKHV